MKKIRDSNIAEYTTDFWAKELRKGNHPKDPSNLVGSIPEYKLPKPHNNDVVIWEIQTKDELLGIRIHEYMREDDWMKLRGLNGLTDTRLDTAAKAFISQNFFTAAANQAQSHTRYYHHWKNRGTYAGQVLGSLSMFTAEHP